MKPDLEPIPDDVLALLADARPIDELAPARRASILSSVQARIDLPPPDGGGDGGGESGSGESGAGTAGSAPATGVPPPLLASAASGLTLAGARAAIALATTFAIGVGAGVAADRSAREPAPAPAIVTAGTVASAVSSSASPSSSMARAVDPAVPVSALPAVPVVAPSIAAARDDSPATPSPSSGGLAAERALLDVARSALARGEAGEALTAADRHSREYPDGAMAEEREAIAVKALVAVGRRDEARNRANALEKRYPNSLMLRAVKGAVERAP